MVQKASLEMLASSTLKNRPLYCIDRMLIGQFPKYPKQIKQTIALLHSNSMFTVALVSKG